jgi:hypothetical protein
MDKIALTQYATSEYNRQQYNMVLVGVQQQINRGADGYLFPTKRLTSADSPYDMSLNDAVLICDTTSGNITINLKPAMEWEQKRIIVKKIVAGNTVTITPDGSETIDGAASLAITTQYQARELVSQGGDIWTV